MQTSKKEAKFKSEDGKKTMTVTIQLISEINSQSSGSQPDVQAYQEPAETFSIDSGTRRLTITIAE